MKPFTLSIKSWHFKLANFPAPHIRGHNLEKYDLDLCTYLRYILINLAVIIAGIVIIGAALYLYGATLYDMWNRFVDGETMREWTAGFFALNAVVMSGSLVFFSATQFSKWLQLRRYNRHQKWRETHPHWYLESKEENDPTFLQLAYKRFKDKTCVQIQLVGDDHA